MAKPKITWEMTSWGIYSEWDSKSKDLPKIKSFDDKIPAKVGVEFGYIVNIKKAKGKKLYYCIDHPRVLDEKGMVMPPFEGEVYVKTNDWDFFLGDTIWEPVYEKVGPWRLTLELEGTIIADKTFEIIADLPE